jgi:CheY-like chemotaxis protein/anti-sigma regulatory factor (Ser/Thr protein kinase)
LEIKPTPLASAVNDAKQMVAGIAAKKNLTIVDSCAADLVVQTDPQRLKQILINLLSNAVKYNRPDGTVTITTTVSNDRVRIAVVDTGIGITEENQRKLFNAFERLDAAEAGIEGVGIGLVLTKRLVEAMGGTVSVESVRGEGSTFSFDLPLERPEPEAALAEPAAFLPQSAVLLHVEDDPSAAQVVAACIARFGGIELLTVRRGTDAIELARERHIDVVLLDLNLPDIDGFDVLRSLRDDPNTADVPVVVLSGDDRRIAELEQHDRVAAVLFKPCAPVDLVDAIHRALLTMKRAA